MIIPRWCVMKEHEALVKYVLTTINRQMDGVDSFHYIYNRLKKWYTRESIVDAYNLVNMRIDEGKSVWTACEEGWEYLVRHHRGTPP